MKNFKYNIWRDLLKDLPKSKLKIISNDPKDQNIADQMTDLMNYYRKENDNCNPI